MDSVRRKISSYATRFLSLSALAALLLIGGCGTNQCGLEVCDITENKCQQTIIAATACLRGDAPAPDGVSVRTVGEAAYLERSLAEVKEETDEERFALFNDAYALFGLATEETEIEKVVQERIELTVAAYSPSAGEITVIDRDHPMDTRAYVSLLVHETVHFLQDQQLDLDEYDKTRGQTLDQSLAANALIEGEATLIGDLASIDLFGTEPDEVPWHQVAWHYQNWSRRAYYDVDAPIYLADVYFSYAYGLNYVYRAWNTGGMAAVKRLYQDVPESTRRVMMGYGTSPPENGGWVDGMEEVSHIDLPPFELIGTDRLGAWILQLFFHRQELHEDETADGERLAGDVFSVLHDSATSDLVAVWRLRFSGRDIADNYARLLSDAGPWAAWPLDQDLVLLASKSSELRDRLKQEISFRPPPEP